MSILLNRKTRVLVQGITGRVGRAQTRFMLDYGTNIVAGVTPGIGGEEVEGIPVFTTVDEAVAKRGAEASVFFVPPPAVKETAIQTIKAGIKLIAVVTERIPVHDVMEIREYVRDTDTWLIVPTSRFTAPRGNRVSASSVMTYRTPGGTVGADRLLHIAPRPHDQISLFPPRAQGNLRDR